ncbi:MAG: hypothetical protein FWC40_10275 [Proteobacteria bacterium]|nr:hypothetical protein [Pseudomonadota bacterium]
MFKIRISHSSIACLAFIACLALFAGAACEFRDWDKAPCSRVRHPCDPNSKVFTVGYDPFDARASWLQCLKESAESVCIDGEVPPLRCCGRTFESDNADFQVCLAEWFSVNVAIADMSEERGADGCTTPPVAVYLCKPKCCGVEFASHDDESYLQCLRSAAQRGCDGNRTGLPLQPPPLGCTPDEAP